MSSPDIRIIIADDHKMIRESWKILLENKSRFKVIADCKNGDEAVALARELLPDILLVDINMSSGNGFDVARKVLSVAPSVKVIGMSVNNQPKFAVKMIELGARGYLTKTSSWEEITEGIIQVYNGTIYICEEVKKHIPSTE